MSWKNRIVASGAEAPENLLANPFNWRVHNERQQRLAEASLDDIGWAQEVIVNRTTGHLVDGHLRVTLAMRKGEASVPVTYVELSETEEKLALAALDPITMMAQSNAHLFAQLLEHAATGSADLMAYIGELAEDMGAVEPGAPAEPKPAVGATELDAGKFEDFAHHCPCCGFEFDA